MSVLLGNGDGTFQAARSFAVDGGPFFVTIGDFNRDSRPDLAVANSGSGRIAVLLGNGDGTFQAPVFLAPGNALSVWSVAVGDFNGDGSPDLVAANNGADTVSVLLGNGDGTFAVRCRFRGRPRSDLRRPGRLQQRWQAGCGGRERARRHARGIEHRLGAARQRRRDLPGARGPSRSEAFRGPWPRATSTEMARRIWRPPTRPPRRSRCCWVTATALSPRRSPLRSATIPRGWRPGTSTAMADRIWRSPMRDPTRSPCCSATATGRFSHR